MQQSFNSLRWEDVPCWRAVESGECGEVEVADTCAARSTGTFPGVNNIVQKLVTLNGIKTVRHQVKNVDCQPSPPHNGILVFVTGHVCDGLHAAHGPEDEHCDHAFS